MAKHSVTMTCRLVDHNPNLDAWPADHWKCTLRYGRRSMTAYFSMGPGHNRRTPEVDEVLESLFTDAWAENCTLEAWANDLGYSADSRSAERTYKLCVRTARKLHRFLGDDFGAVARAIGLDNVVAGEDE